MLVVTMETMVLLLIVENSYDVTPFKVFYNGKFALG